MQDFATISPLQALFAALLGYGLGSIPFGLILTRMAGLKDIREIGSKSIGATNVLRTGRKDLALGTVLLDALKGTFAVLIAQHWGLGAGIIAGMAAFIGHCYPFTLRFKGGKGVATFIGVLLALWFPGAVIFGVVWLGVAFISRYSSLSSLAATLIVPAVRVVMDLRAGALGGIAIALCIMSVVLWWKHRENIARLRAGNEGKIGQKA